MAELKTKPGGDVMTFLESIKEKEKKKDCMLLLNLMKQITKEEPILWGGRIVGFGTYEYKGKSGRSGTWFMTGFSSNKQNLTVYIISGFSQVGDILKNLGKFKTSVSCLYINKLSDIDINSLEKLISFAYKNMKEKASK